MSVLGSISGPADLRRLDADQLSGLAAEIREFLIDSITRTGGHLGPNLGAVELTLAVHRVFESPTDRILWDTGHQAYVHKLLTGRQDFSRLRKAGGISGYPNRQESEHDIIENSHASTALSYADGLAKGFALRGEQDRAVVAVVGDGALTGGMCWEALNNISSADRPVIIVLNDNGRSYAPTVGGLARHLAALRNRPRSAGGNIFTELGLAYLGPVDGHDVAATEEALQRARGLRRPVVVHCLTTKGRGYRPAETDPDDRLHSVGVINPLTGEPFEPGAKTWTDTFGAELTAVGDDRPDVVAVTAAMLLPTGLRSFAAAHPERTYDVGIAEQHAVTSAAGLATAGLHPVVAVYATFLNRAFDQALMDVALHRLPVTFVLDRAGVTGSDGPSHNGMWDLSVLPIIPGLRLAAPRDAATLRAELREAIAVEDGPTALRFPKAAVGPDLPALDRFGGADLLRVAADDGSGPLIVSVGAMAQTCLDLADLLAAQDVESTVVDPRWVMPVDPALVELAAQHRLVVTVEDGCRGGGIGGAIAQALRAARVPTPVRDFGLPRAFLQHGTRSDILAACGLGADAMADEVLRELAVHRPSSRLRRRRPGGRSLGRLRLIPMRRAESDRPRTRLRDVG